MPPELFILLLTDLNDSAKGMSYKDSSVGVKDEATASKVVDNIEAAVTSKTKKWKKKRVQNSSSDRQSNFGDVEILKSLVFRLEAVSKF